MSKQKAKGSSWERDLAKHLSETYGSSFIRNISGSGAYVGGKNIHRTATLSEEQIRNTRGDVCVPESFSRLNIECKNYADFAWHLLLDEHKQLSGWIDQLMCVSNNNDVNLLAFKITRRGRYIAVQSGLEWNRSCSHITYHDKKHGEWIIYSFEKFFEFNTDLLRDFSKIG